MVLIDKKKKNLKEKVLSECDYHGAEFNYFSIEEAMDKHNPSWGNVRAVFRKVNFDTFDERRLFSLLYQKQLEQHLEGCNNLKDCLYLTLLHIHDPKGVKRGAGKGYKRNMMMTTDIRFSFDKVLNKLVGEGLIEVVGEDSTTHRTIYRIEESGHTLRMQSTSKPISREKADELVMQIIEVVDKINKDPASPHFVSSVHVFGSYLTNNEILNDLDIGVELKAKGLNVQEDENAYDKWIEKDRAYGGKYNRANGYSAIMKQIGFSNSISITPYVELSGLVSEGKAVSKEIYSL